MGDMALRDLILNPWQPPGVNHFCDNPRSAVLARPGSGKTSLTLYGLDVMDMAGEDVFPALVGAPLRVARDVWVDEPAKWNQLCHLKTQPIIGTLEQRIAALRNDKAQVYTVNYEQIPWLVDQLGDDWPFKTVVADESTKLKSYRLRGGGVRATALAEIARKTRRWLNLTGTPAPRGLIDLWGQMWFLDHGVRLGRTFEAFQQRWFQRAWDGYGSEPLQFAEAEIHQRIKDLCLYINLKDYVDIAEPVFRRVEVKMPEKARIKYREMERKLYTEIKTYQITAANSAVKSNKLLQMANGAVYVNKEHDWEELHTAKLEALESIVAECGGMPILVGYAWKHDLARLLKWFPQARDISTKEGLRDFKAGKVGIGCAHPGSLGHGVDGLQYVTNIGVFFGEDWNFEYRDQLLERIGPTRQWQAKLDREVIIYDIVAYDTMDDVVLDRHDSKETVQDALLKYLSAKYR